MPMQMAWASSALPSSSRQNVLQDSWIAQSIERALAFLSCGTYKATRLESTSQMPRRFISLKTASLLRMRTLRSGVPFLSTGAKFSPSGAPFTQAWNRRQNCHVPAFLTTRPCTIPSSP